MLHLVKRDNHKNGRQIWTRFPMDCYCDFLTRALLYNYGITFQFCIFVEIS